MRRHPKAVPAIAAVLLCLFALPSAASAVCPNEAIREAQHAGHLADCRAWEMVSPLDKNNGDIVADGLTTIAAREGGAVAFNGRTGFADIIGWGVSGQTQYLARRGESGWTTKAITPTPQPEAKQTFFAATHLQIFSEDLRTAVLDGYDLPAATGDLPFHDNLYTEDTATRELRTVTASETGIVPFLPFGFASPQVWGISDDARHVAFASNTPFLPATEGSTANNVYQWDDGTLSLAGVLPDGSVPEGGSDVVPSNYRRAMSADGSRQLFSATPPSGSQLQLYQRIDGDRTVLISESENPSFGGEPENVYLQAATPDGKNVFFVTDSPLLEAADQTPSADLYRWTDSPDPEGETGNLTLIGGASQDLVFGGSVAGVSDDGQVVYIHTSGNELKVWDHGTTRLISADVAHDSFPPNQLTATASLPGLGRVTTDGKYLTFLTYGTLNADQVHGLTGQITNAHLEVYQYSLEDDELSCLSCPAGEATADARVEPATNQGPNVTSGAVNQFNVAIRPRFLADDGRTFFSTPEALLPEDTNGTLDAYEYDPATGELSLLSSGRGSEPSAFLDASASGDEVFIATRQSLVGTDSDHLVDVYTVRTDGGFPEPEPQPSPCQGEGCQGAGPAPPGTVATASGAVTRGNVSPARCGKGKRRVRREGKVRCVRKKHQQSGADRGGSR